MTHIHPLVSEKISQRWDLGGTFNQDFLAVEVDLVVLSKELIKLGEYCGRIGDSFRGLRSSLQEADLVQRMEDV